MAPTLPPPTQLPANPGFIRYINAAKQAQCPEDQIRNFLRARVVLQARQLEASAAARLCDLEGGPTEIGYGGARGGGKTFWLLTQIACDDCQRFPGLKCLILRKVGKSLKEAIGDLVRSVLVGVEFTWVPSQSTIHFPNGSRIILGHFQKESDIDTYLGLEYDIIGVEESTTLSLSKYKAIRTCCRTSKPGWRPRLYTTTNPGNLGHAWYKALFVDPATRGEQKDTYFVPATVDDNAFVNKEYKATLDKLTGWQLRAWRYGDWDIAAGQYFTNFRKTIDGKPHHVWPNNHRQRAANWPVWCSLDYGFTHFTMCHLLCKDGDGNVICLDEHGERGWVVKRHADAIKAMLSRNGLTLANLIHFVAGADVFSQRGGEFTIAEQYANEGIKLEAANDDRINGASEILNRFGDVEATRKNERGEEVPAPLPARLFIVERCRMLTECIPALQHDPHRAEDVLKVDCDEEGIGGDDPYDSFRYGVMAAYSPKINLIKRPANRTGYGYA